MAQTTILVIDDEPQIRRAVRNALADDDVRVVEAATGSAGLDVAAAERPSLVILDLGLPDVSGLEVCRELRTWSSAPIIVLSARHSDQEKVALLDAGADDYVTKPFATGERLARLRAALRRAGPSAEPVLVVGPIRVDLEKRAVTVSDKPIHLTPLEYRILRVLAQNPGKLLTHRTILREVWGPAYGDESNYLHVYVSQLRKKLEADPASPRLLLTEPGAGYRLVDQP
jgi:two-component system KDP operon response regulator KdpE